MRARLVLALLAILALVVVLQRGLAPVAAQEAEDPRHFDGWIISRYGEDVRYLSEDDWERELVSRDAFSLRRRGERVSAFGTFRAERLDELSHPPEDEEPDEGEFDGWVVEQFGQTRRYARLNGWKGEYNPDGFVLRRRGQIVWYYGTFQVREIRDVKLEDR